MQRANSFNPRAFVSQQGFPLLLILLLGTVPLFTDNEYIRHLTLVGMLFGAQAMVSDFTIGFINISNFGFAGFFGVGSYTTGILTTRYGISPFAGLIAGMLMSGLLGVFTGVLTVRLRGLYVSIMAWFMALALQALALVMVDVTRGAWGLFVDPMFKSESILPSFYTLLLITILVYIVIKTITQSKIGLAFRAIGMDLDYARASGVYPARYKMVAYTLSCAFAGLLGAFYAHFIGILTPDVMGTQHTVEVIALNVIGGRGSVWGGLLAGFVVIPPFEYLKSLMEIRLIIYGALLTTVMVFYPAGMSGLIRRIGDRLRKRNS